MIKSFNAEILKRHFLDKNCRFDLPFLLVIDCDRTIVDRKRGGHFVHVDEGDEQALAYADFVMKNVSKPAHFPNPHATLRTIDISEPSPKLSRSIGSAGGGVGFLLEEACF